MRPGCDNRSGTWNAPIWRDIAPIWRARPYDRGIATEADLWDRYWASRSIEDRNALVEHHLPMTAELVRRWGRRGQWDRRLGDNDDALSVAAMVLIGAVESFEPARGIAFAAYAAWAMRKRFGDEFRRLNPESRATVEFRGRRQRATDALEQHLGRLPNEAEVAAALGMALPDYRLALRDDDVVIGERQASRFQHRNDQIGTDQQEWEDDPWTEGLRPCSPSAEDEAEVSVSLEGWAQALAAAVEALPERQRVVLALHYLDGLSYREVAGMLGCSHATVSDTASRGLRGILERRTGSLEALLEHA